MNNRAVQMAATISSASFFNGGNWGFLLNSNHEFDRIIEILDSEPAIKKIAVNNGYIVFCDFNYLAQVINQVYEDKVLVQESINKRNTRLSTEILEFQKFMTSLVKGGSKYLQDMGEYYECSIGIYSVNSMHKTRVNGIEYPAFSLELSEALKELVKMTKMTSVYVNTGIGFERIDDIISSNNTRSVFEGIEISNSTTCAFLTIRLEK